MKSWNEIGFAPYDFVESLGGEEYEYITPGEMEQYIRKKEEDGKSSNDEKDLFYALNKGLLRR